MRAVVLGAGIGGLVAARELRRGGHEVLVLEAAKQVAGLSATTVDEDGFSFDLGAHFITNRLAAAIGVSASCRTVRYYGESVWLDGRHYRYPTGLLTHPAMVASAVRTKLRPSHAPIESAADWFRAAYGTALADRVALPLVEAWSGAPASELSAAVGDKIPGSLAQTLALRVAARVTRRAVAIGYCGEQPQSPAVYHVYPEHGVATLCQHLASELGDAVRTESPVEAIIVEDERAVAVRSRGEVLETDLVVSTAPVHILPKLVEGTDSLDRFARFRFRPMVFVSLKLTGTALLDDVVVWVPEGAPYFRLTEATQSMPWLAPAGKTTILCDIGAEVGDHHWTMTDDELAELCLGHVERLVPDIRRRYIGAHVMRLPLAYPVFLRDYENDRRQLEEIGTGVEGLASIGRNGEFAHILMEDVYWRTTRRIHGWLADHERRQTAVPR